MNGLNGGKPLGQTQDNFQEVESLQTPVFKDSKTFDYYYTNL